MIFSLVLALAIAIVAVIFALGNTDPVIVSFLAWQVEQPLALVLLASVALGILIGVLLMTPNVIKQKLALAGEKKKLKGSEKALDEQKAKVDELNEKEEERKRTLEEKKARILAEAKGIENAEDAK